MESTSPSAGFSPEDEACADSRRRLELAVEAAKVGTWTFDVRTGKTWYSARSKQMYGLAPDTEMTTSVIRKSVHPDDWEEVSRPYLTGFIEEEKVEVEYRVMCPDGSTRWIYSLGAARRDEQGVARMINGIHLDITDRKQAEQELEETRRQFELAVTGANLGSWTIDMKTLETWYCARSRERYGVDGDLHFDAQALQAFIHPEDWDMVLEGARQSYQSGSMSLDHRVVWPSGDVRWVHSVGTVEHVGNGEALLHGIHLDITERKQAEQDLARSREALHQSEKLAALGSLLAGVSHELNNPLAAIVGQAEMLEEDSQGTIFEARAKKISAAAERCARIVQTFLAMARQKEAQRSLIDLNELVASSLEITEYALRTAGIAVRVTLGTMLPKVLGDRDQLHQVLVNLIVNAQHAMQGGEAFDKTLTLRTSVSQSGEVLLDVSDTGPGVPEKLRGRIFEPFFTTKPQGMGTGVGLSFSHGIVAAHGGTIGLEPSRRGAHFRLTLPPAAESDLVAVPVDSATGAAAGAGGTALIVEDEADVAETLRELLEREGFAVTVAGDGASALMAIDRGDYDLILSDLRMPGVSGPDLHARLAETRPHLIERMGFVTGDTLGSSMDDFLRNCGRPVLEKPFTKTGVRCLVASLVKPKVPA